MSSHRFVKLCLILFLVSFTNFAYATYQDENTEKAISPVVTLIDRGEKPYRELRYDFSKMVKQTYEFKLLQDVSTTMDGVEIPSQPTPDLMMQIHFDINHKNKNKENEIIFHYGELAVLNIEEIPQSVQEILTSTFKSFKDVGGSMSMDERGYVKDSEIQIPDEIPLQIQQAMKHYEDQASQMATPLPEEAVGIGGKWQVDQILDMGVLTLRQSVTYEIIRIEGQNIYLSMKLKQDADAKDINEAVRFSTIDSSGTGSMTLSLDRLAPLMNTLKTTAKMSFEVSMGDNKGEMKVVNHISFDGASKDLD